MKTFKYYLEELRKPAEVEKFRDAVRDIKSVDSRNETWKTALPVLMRKFKFRLLGQGKYASVYGNPTYKYVIKVFMKDAAYSKWLAFVFKNRKNKFLPDVRGKVVKVTDVFHVIRLEKLTPYDPSAESSKEFMNAYRSWQKDNSFRSGNSDIDDILGHFEKNKSLLDIHGENVMMRGNQLVVIDPYYNWFRTSDMKFTIDPDKIDQSIF